MSDASRISPTKDWLLRQGNNGGSKITLSTKIKACLGGGSLPRSSIMRVYRRVWMISFEFENNSSIYGLMSRCGSSCGARLFFRSVSRTWTSCSQFSILVAFIISMLSDGGSI